MSAAMLLGQVKCCEEYQVIREDQGSSVGNPSGLCRHYTRNEDGPVNAVLSTLKPESLAKMTTPFKQGYAFGLGVSAASVHKSRSWSRTKKPKSPT